MGKVSKEKILRELSAVAFSDYTEFVSVETASDGCQVVTVTDTPILKRNSRKAVAMVKAGTKGVEIKLYDKLKALELMGRTIGLFTEKKTDDGDELIERLGSLLGKVGDDDEDEADE